MADDYYQCLTCNWGLITDSCICSRCIKVCHADHNVKYIGNDDKHFCDCGAKGTDICPSLQPGKFDFKKGFGFSRLALKYQMFTQAKYTQSVLIRNDAKSH